jgi:hypothetical protein
MTTDDLVLTIEDLRKRTALLQPRRAPLDDKVPPSGAQSSTTWLEHAAWMLEEMKTWELGKDKERAMYWMGFVQALLCSAGICTINDTKEASFAHADQSA